MSRLREEPAPFGAVVFDMDGVLFDTEHVWHEVRGGVAAESGGRWDEGDQRTVMGMNSAQWSSYMHEQCGVPAEPREIYERVVARQRERNQRDPPLYAGAGKAVAAVSGRYELAVASSSPLELIVAGIEAAGLSRFFAALVSSDEVALGKPSPDVYLEACARLNIRPHQAVAIEDSANGIRAAVCAGLKVIAIPNPGFPPGSDVVGMADHVLESISELTPEVIRTLSRQGVEPGL